MHVAASSHCFANLPFFEACPQITDLGYDRVEIWCDAAGAHLSLQEATEDGFPNRLRENTRLTPVGFFVDSDVSSEMLAALISTAKTLRIAQITVPASPLGTPFNTEVDRLREFVGLARPDGLRISIKTRIGDLTEDPRTAVELCQAVPGLGITLDPSHYVCGPYASESYDPVFPHVFHLHLRDSSPTELQVPVGRGEIDYSRLILMLEKQNYTQALSVDFDPAPLDNETRELEMRKLRMLLDSLL